MNSWDSRYAHDRFFYGKEPNLFFADEIKKLKPGKLLLPAEGEGRNAIFAARLGWEVTAFDSSEVAREKALRWAESEQLNIRYDHLAVEDFHPDVESYDAIALIFTHFMPEVREAFFQKLIRALKPGGIMIAELFEKNQLIRNTGGPKNIDMLVSCDVLRDHFATLSIESLSHEIIHLNEGPGHSGEAEVVRMLAMRQLDNVTM